MKEFFGMLLNANTKLIIYFLIVTTVIIIVFVLIIIFAVDKSENTKSFSLNSKGMFIEKYDFRFQEFAMQKMVPTGGLEPPRTKSKGF